MEKEQMQKLILEQIDAVQLVLTNLRKSIEDYVNEELTEGSNQEVEKEPVTKEPAKKDVVVTPVDTKKGGKKSAKAEPAKEEVKAPAEEEEKESVDELQQVIDDYGLADMEVAGLKEMLDEYEVTYNKRDKSVDALAKVVAQAIIDGVIPTEEEEEATNADENVVEASSPAEENSEDEESTASEERLEAEDFVEQEVKRLFDAKKLKASKMKEELSAYYAGDEDCSNCGGCPEEELLECYIRMKQAFVDDEGEEHDPEEAYYRDGVLHCCGAPCVQDPDNENLMVCEICGTPWDVSE